MKPIFQVPAKGYDWLTELTTADEKDRKFAKGICRPAGSKPWDNWTQAQWQAWQDEYNPQPEPPEEE